MAPGVKAQSSRYAPDTYAAGISGTPANLTRSGGSRSTMRLRNGRLDRDTPANRQSSERCGHGWGHGSRTLDMVR